MPVNLMKRCGLYFLGFLIAVLTATAAKLSDYHMKLDVQSDIAAEITADEAEPCDLPESTRLEKGVDCPDYKQKP